MNQALITPDVSQAQTHTEPFPVHAFASDLTVSQNDEVMHDIERRATMLGPVFEEMFLYHWEQFNWEHWEHGGINE